MNFPGFETISFIKYRSRSGFTRIAFEIPTILKKYKIDYAHFQYIIPPLKKCRYIVSTHDVIFSEYPDEFSMPYRIIKKFLFKQSGLRADMVTTVSAYSKRSIQKYLKVPADKFAILPNAVSSELF